MRYNEKKAEIKLEKNAMEAYARCKSEVSQITAGKANLHENVSKWRTIKEVLV